MNEKLNDYEIATQMSFIASKLNEMDEQRNEDRWISRQDFFQEEKMKNV